MLYFHLADKGKPEETRGRKANRPNLSQNREGLAPLGALGTIDMGWDEGQYGGWVAEMGTVLQKWGSFLTSRPLALGRAVKGFTSLSLSAFFFF